MSQKTISELTGSNPLDWGNIAPDINSNFSELYRNFNGLRRPLVVSMMGDSLTVSNFQVINLTAAGIA